MLELVIVMLIVATLMALIVPTVLKVREMQARTQTEHNLKELTLACWSCNDLHRKLPPATGEFGTPAVTGTVPTMEDCNPSYTPHSLLRSGISVSLFDGSVRSVSPNINTELWGKAVQPNDGIPLGSRDWP